MNCQEEVTELVGMYLWDIFSDNHDVIAAVARVADIGSFRSASRRGPGSFSRWQVPRFFLGSSRLSETTDAAEYAVTRVIKYSSCATRPSVPQAASSS